MILSIQWNNAVRHVPVHDCSGNGYYIEVSTPFVSMSQLVDYYTTNVIEYERQQITLTNPILRQASSDLYGLTGCEHIASYLYSCEHLRSSRSIISMYDPERMEHKQEKKHINVKVNTTVKCQNITVKRQQEQLCR
ncbi:unnamed protein product [Toxocara canis]|uniref:SH2 domain-containing protein n=1 Tax=Toxocara canis TaxID=6265 RepID=A0A183UP46_TOXCA|nr:unnamed protein product [Toxocara canis]